MLSMASAELKFSGTISRAGMVISKASDSSAIIVTISRLSRMPSSMSVVQCSKSASRPRPFNISSISSMAYISISLSEFRSILPFSRSGRASSRFIFDGSIYRGSIDRRYLPSVFSSAVPM